VAPNRSCPAAQSSEQHDTYELTGRRGEAGDYWVLARRPGRRGTILTLVGPSLIFVKLEDHDIRAPILGMGRDVAISRRIPVPVKATTNRHDLPRTVLLAPALNQVNCVREPRARALFRAFLSLATDDMGNFLPWHIAALDVCDGTSAVGESRHRIPGVSVGQPTEPCLDEAGALLDRQQCRGGDQLGKLDVGKTE
jgi:hypothetical protein